ncbi:intradiol ring-cleavage dioxygenase [Pontibacter litorisediminis]|uniref:dioxygenase family protein n=1 Tax=Pontibacter litorisediminis TaxID=1846260 RepID=UPI0023ED2784|nr:intradiol ring-cleavage dioxygenase [Pontibacter litorisediminis]
MNNLLHLCLFACSLIAGTACDAQSGGTPEGANAAAGQATSQVGGYCDTCELMYVGMPENIDATDTSASWNAAGQKLRVSGTIYKHDGKTPAPNVILYYWQTNSEGIYADSKGLDPKVRPHGYIRGWVKTDAQGHYSLYTTRPGHYPGRSGPAHIHLLVKEPRLPSEYYIDDILFEDDPLLTKAHRNKLENRGGSGIVQTRQENDLQVAIRDIVLGQNIPGYPEAD